MLGDAAPALEDLGPGLAGVGAAGRFSQQPLKAIQGLAGFRLIALGAFDGGEVAEGAVVDGVVPQFVAGEIVQEARIFDLGFGEAGARLEEETVAQHELGLGELGGTGQVLLQVAEGEPGLVELPLLHLLVGRGHQFGGADGFVDALRFAATQAQARHGGDQGEGGEDSLHADSGDNTSFMAGRWEEFQGEGFQARRSVSSQGSARAWAWARRRSWKTSW